MKLLKLIPAAAVALTAFTTFEAKAEKVCVVNNAMTTINVYVKNDCLLYTSPSPRDRG